MRKQNRSCGSASKKNSSTRSSRPRDEQRRASYQTLGVLRAPLAVFAVVLTVGRRKRRRQDRNVKLKREGCDQCSAGFCSPSPLLLRGFESWVITSSISLPKSAKRELEIGRASCR